MTAHADLRRVFPALRSSRRLQLGAHGMHYVDVGQGAPILCVHGNPTWSFYWRAVIERFQTKARILAVDHLGCGLSDKPQDFDYCLENHVANLVHLVERLDLTDITLLVHDWGGAIGIGAASRCPDRFKQAVFTNTGCFPPPFVPWRIRVCRLPVVGTWLNRGLNAFARAAVTMATTRRGGLGDDARLGLLAPYDSWHNRIAIDRFVKDIPLSSRHRTWKRLKEVESGLQLFSQKPCLMLWGMRDWCFRPSVLQMMRQRLPAAQVIEFADAGHYLMEDAPSGVCAALEAFLFSPSPAGEIGA